MTKNKRSAQVVWREQMTFDATTESGHQLVLDTSAAGGGDNCGPTPMELVLVALAGCTAMDIVSILQKKREPLKGLNVSVEGIRAHRYPHVYTELEVVYHVRGSVKPKALAHAIELSETKYCSVGAMLGQAAKITTRYEIEPDEEHAGK